jgi:hypothetical protein
MNGKKAKLLRWAADREIGSVLQKAVTSGKLPNSIPDPRRVYQRLKREVKCNERS